MVCGRSKVALVYSVQGVLWTWTWPGQPTRRREGYAAEHFARLSLRQRTTARCLFTAECTALYEARRARQRQRAGLPEDAVLRELHPPRRGWCRWCGEMIFQLDKDGHVRQNRTGRMWHEARVIHPDAEPEPNCIREYSAQGFTFRDQVFRRDRGVCASCDRDVEAERRAWEAQRPDAAVDYDTWSERQQAWLRLEPRWEADHIVPLEDDGEHTLANAQTLCQPCHSRKTAWENSGRAAQRRVALL